ncbi:MAG: DNA primase small subunit domain-containing protein [Sulfolobales archaeon]
MALSKENLKFVRELFSRYYRLAPIKLPKDLGSREFAFQLLDTDSYVRHLSFTSESELRAYLAINTPKQAYYSTAKYSNPSAPDYSEAGWQGSEIMFDIDADKLPGCKTQVLAEKVEVVTAECIEIAKNALRRLLHILEEHIGFSKDELMVYFSGNRGFHVIVASDDPEWLTLGSIHRLELVDYVAARGLNLRRIFRGTTKRGFRIAPPTPRDGGWRSLIASYYGGEFSDESVEKAVESIAVAVDPLVTQDTSRLIRIPNSLNGKTGLVASLIKIDDVDKFKFDESLTPFEGYAIIKPRASLNGVFLGKKVTLSENVISKVDKSTALYMVLNGLANVVRYSLTSTRRVSEYYY